MSMRDDVLERFMVGFVEFPSEYRWPTLGRLITMEPFVYTIEDPWNGNRKGDSCIPDGTYDLVPHKRPSGVDCYLMVNPALNVYAYDADVPVELKGSARTLCIAGHAGSFEDDIEGCFAVGEDPEIIWREKAKRYQLGIRSSATALARWQAALGVGVKGHRLTIRTTQGARL